MGFISIHIPDSLEEYMFTLVENGVYRTNSEVVEAALRALSRSSDSSISAPLAVAYSQAPKRQRRAPDDPIVRMLKNANLAASRSK